jgi:hypothetical protein
MHEMLRTGGLLSSRQRTTQHRRPMPPERRRGFSRKVDHGPLTLAIRASMIAC